MAARSFLHDARRWASPDGVMGLAVAVAMVVMAACGGLFLYARTAVNEVAAAREHSLVDRAIDRRLARLKADVASVSVWDDAYEFTARKFSPAWAQTNYGVYFAQYLGHTDTVIFDSQDRPVYAARRGQRVDPASVAEFVAATRPLRDAVRKRAAAKIQGNPRALAFDRAGQAEAAVRAGKKVYLAAASSIVPEPAYAKPLLKGPEVLVVSAVEIDPAFLKALSDDYGLHRAALLASPQPSPASAQLHAVDGAPLGAIGWQPEQLGDGVILRAKWQILGFGLVVVAAVILLVMRLRELARVVVEARDLAEAGDRAKSEFIANMSHEIRTPLNGVLGMAQVMEGDVLSPDQRSRLKVIRDSGATLLALLNDVLDLSKIEAGKFELQETTFTLETLAREACATFEGIALAKGVRLSLEMEAPDGAVWTGDGMRIRQVLSNLISNAVKFTACGSVVLSIRPEPGAARFAVKDTGIGLTEAEVSRLFGKFAQADASTTRRYGGTGLGLFISNALVARMGGTIAVTSRPGEGSTFAVTLPLWPVSDGAVGDPDVATGAEATDLSPALRILAAEDNATNQLVLRAMLDPIGAELVLVDNGRQALEAFERQAFDVVLMDIQMPSMNGIDATLAIRTLEKALRRPRTPILALSANVMSHQLADYVAAGMDGHIAKPLDTAALYAALDAALSPSAPASVAA